MLQKPANNQKGFTLIELMIVIAIIGILSAIAIPNFLSYRTRGSNEAAKSEAKNYLTLALTEVADTGAFAAPPTGFEANSDVTMVGTLAISTTGVISGTPTFVHVTGTTTYTINNDGTISGA